MVDFLQPEARAPLQHVAAMVEPVPQRLLEGDHARHDAVHKHVHVHREADLELRRLEQLSIIRLGIDRAGARLDDDTDILRRFVSNIGEQRQILLGQKLGDLLDQPRFLHHDKGFR